MTSYKPYEIWFITGSQHLYGPGVLNQVASDSTEIAAFFDASESISINVVFKPVVINSDKISEICREANASKECVGLICWMHTFSPAKMWIAGLQLLNKPFLHLHTQFNREIPWDSIDMNFMNLNQSAHGDREFGFINTRMNLRRKVVAGFWRDKMVLEQIDNWVRAAVTHEEMQKTRVARFGDNMRDVAVTEGNKVSAQMAFGYSVQGFGVGDLVSVINEMGDAEVDHLVNEYLESYSISKDIRQTKTFSQLREAARIELGMRHFLKAGDFTAFTTTFEDLHGLSQLPGLACQRLMNDGFGFGAEGDWKTAALVRAMKIMGRGLKGGTSFMEDYTYHMPENKTGLVLGSHMLEVCPSISAERPSLEIHPLSIGGKSAPARLLFTAAPGPGLNATLLDMGNRFRMLINEVDVITPSDSLPKLPVAKALWIPKPDLATSATSWIYGGGAHHTGFSQAVRVDHLRDYCDILDIECLVIDETTTVNSFRNELRNSQTFYQFSAMR